MRFLKLCFLLMVFGTSTKAQEKDTCFYHVSFYKWEWNYCYGLDTIANHDKKGNRIDDTIIFGYANHPNLFFLEIKDSASFNNLHFEVTSIDGKINYEVKSFTLLWYRENNFNKHYYATRKSIYCKGAYLTKHALKVLHNLPRYPNFFITDLKIFDFIQQKKNSLQGIAFSVK